MTNPNDPAFGKEIPVFAIDSAIVEMESLYPQIKDKIQKIGHAYIGLTKREYFAAMAFSGMNIGDSPPDKAAEWAVEYADALIAELSK